MIIRYIFKFSSYLLCLMILLIPDVYINASEGEKDSVITHADNRINWGMKAFNRGDFAEAIRQWEKAAEIYTAEEKSAELTDLFSRMTEAYQATGQYHKAADITFTAIESARKRNNKTEEAMFMGILGQLYLFTGDLDKSKDYLDKALRMLKTTEEPGVVAAILNNIGNLSTAREDYEGAVAAYKESVKYAKESDNLMLAAKAYINWAGVLYEQKKYHEAMNQLNNGLADLRNIADSHDKSYALIAAGQVINRIRRNPDALPEISDTEMINHAFEIFTDAQKISASLNDLPALSYAMGYLGNLYEEKQKYEEALQLTRKAVFTAQKANDAKSLFRWEWQTGRLLNAKGDIDGAVSAYFRSVYTLESVRKNINEACNRNSGLSFRESAGPVYFELADLLLRRSSKIQNPEHLRDDLLKARSAIEQFRLAELQDYFQDECVTTLQTKEISPEQMMFQHTAAIYPILLPDRTELLVNFPDGLKQYTIPAGSKILTAEIREFRSQLQDPLKEYLKLAQKIYDSVIRPLEKDLENREIKTLIFIPDGELRTIPITALHDGKNFLVNKYAVVTTPGLNLTDPRPLQWKNVRILLNGLTESVQGFPSLPNVNAELDAVQNLYECKILKDRNFVSDAVRKELEAVPYSVVHIASHGKFDKDPRKTFLLTYDGKLTMNDLEQLIGMSKFRKEPVELLTLSACQTAAGDDRAALGLAGVALKAGARSAIATLWFINDEATSELVADFYRQQSVNPSFSKAESLQQAQINMLKQEQYKHPAYWAPFLLIGNWL